MQAAASSITQLPTLQLSIQPGALLCTADALRVYGKVLEIPASASNQLTNWFWLNPNSGKPESIPNTLPVHCRPRERLQSVVDSRVGSGGNSSLPRQWAISRGSWRWQLLRTKVLFRKHYLLHACPKDWVPLRSRRRWRHRWLNRTSAFIEAYKQIQVTHTKSPRSVQNRVWRWRLWR